MPGKEPAPPPDPVGIGPVDFVQVKIHPADCATRTGPGGSGGIKLSVQRSWNGVSKTRVAWSVKCAKRDAPAV